MTDRDQHRVLRVGHGAVPPGEPLSALAPSLAGAGWDMVELDVLRSGGRLIVAHDRTDLALPLRVGFEEALAALAGCAGDEVRIDVDVKTAGYEEEVAAAISDSGLSSRTLVSTMERSSLAVFRSVAPGLALGLSVPRVRRNYLAHPLTRPPALATLFGLRRVLPGMVGGVLDRGEADAIMSHWGLVTPRLVSAVRSRGAELFVWTVDERDQLDRMLALGVSGVITNRGDLFD